MRPALAKLAETGARGAILRMHLFLARRWHYFYMVARNLWEITISERTALASVLNTNAYVNFV